MRARNRPPLVTPWSGSVLAEVAVHRTAMDVRDAAYDQDLDPGESLVLIRCLTEHDLAPWIDTFMQACWSTQGVDRFRRYALEQVAGVRQVLLAWDGDAVVGYLTIWWSSGYRYSDLPIPEIRDFNVIPSRQGRGIGSLLLAEAEHRVSTRSPLIGIGVGLHPGYKRAQRLYVRRGSIPDGRGVFYQDETLAAGAVTTNDDDLVLHFTKSVVGLHPVIA